MVAHLSEAIPRLWIADNAALQQFLESELEYGLSLAVQAMVITDVAGTSGIQTQAYSTSVLQTVRKSLTKLEVNVYTPGSIVLNPLDFDGVELAPSTVNAIEHMSLPYDPASRRLFGVPIVASVSETAGVAQMLGTDAVVLDTDTIGVGVQWSETSNSDDFAKNLIQARCEGRFGTSVLSPLGVVSCDLTA